jgi:MFS transporter, FHS family, L-fucose permease
VQAPYLVIGAVVLIWAFLIAMIRLPEAHTGRETSADGKQVGALLQNKNYLLSVFAQFFYVGAQVGIWSYLIRYAQQTLPGLSERSAANFLTASLVLFMIGRFAGTALMRVLPPARLLALFAAIALTLVAIAVFLPGAIGVGALVATSFFMSIHFPTIFALGLRGLGGEARKTASSLLIMAIIGGAILTVAMGAVSDTMGIHRAMLVPTVCFGIVLVFASHTRKLTTAV